MNAMKSVVVGLLCLTAAAVEAKSSYSVPEDGTIAEVIAAANADPDSKTDDERYARVLERIEQGLPMSDAVFDKEAYRFAEALGVATGGHITPRYSNLIVRSAVSAFQKSEYGVAS